MRMFTSCDRTSWAGWDRSTADGFEDYFRQLTEFEPRRAAQYGIQHYTWLGMNPKESDNREISLAVLKRLPKLLDQPTVLGVGEIGMNLSIYGLGSRNQRSWLAVDLGVSFGDEEHLPGIDLIMPDIRFLEKERKNLMGLVLTHAHEDHFGAIRIAPSRRITSPFSISFSKMWRTRAAYSSGRPRRGGNGTC